MDTPQSIPKAAAITSIRPSDEQMQGFAAQAQARLAELQRQHAIHHGMPVAAEAAETNTYTGSATFASAFIWTQVTVTNTDFTEGPNKDFKGSVWGIGIGGGVSWGGGAFSVSSADLGYCKIQVSVASVAVELSFYDSNGAPIGFFMGGGLGVGGFVGGGSGDWT